MSQEIKYIHIRNLVLWTENPRDPVDPNSSEQDIANHAISNDGRSSWSLNKLFNKMGNRFDQSEIPTIAYIDNKPIVYDGNRRVLIGKIIHNLVKVPDNDINFSDFEFPEKIPCNVCDKKTALEHVDRKHADNGSWKPLERDIFKHKHMGEKKSPFLIVEEATKLISKHPDMNQRFVKEEVFDPKTLLELGFSTNDGILKSKYAKDENAKVLLDEIVSLVKNKEITTRKNRGKIINLIDKDILKKQGEKFIEFPHCAPLFTRKTNITKAKGHGLFGDKLTLKLGTVNNLYRDLLKLYKDKKGYSNDFPMIIRMALRLITELAAERKDIKNFIEKYWEEAKKKLSQDEKTTLSNQSIKKQNLIQLLQSGGHGYTASNNLEQTVAMSLIIGKILKLSHGR